MASSKVGETLPDVTVWGKEPGDAVKLREVCADKRCVIVGVPGPFTPVCSAAHVPGFLKAYDKLKELNVDLIAFVSVSDTFVMTAWGKDQNVEDKILMWADKHMELTKALDVVLDAEDVFGTKRSHRFSMFVENNVIKAFFLEDEPGKLTVTSAEDMIKFLSS